MHFGCWVVPVLRIGTPRDEHYESKKNSFLAEHMTERGTAREK
jgi:hypothetical protein